MVDAGVVTPINKIYNVFTCESYEGANDCGAS